MAARFQLALLVVCASVAATLANPLTPENMYYTQQNIHKSCVDPGVHTAEVAQKFLDCYDEIPTKDMFFECQTEVFGRYFDTVDNIRQNCIEGEKGPAYLGCIAREMDKAGIDMNRDVSILNACQLKLF